MASNNTLLSSDYLTYKIILLPRSFFHSYFSVDSTAIEKLRNVKSHFLLRKQGNLVVLFEVDLYAFFNMKLGSEPSAKSFLI